MGFLKGKKQSEETRRRMSVAKKNMSDETKRKLSEAKKGKHHTEETKRKISIGHKGKHHTEETKRKMSIGHKGYKGYKCYFYGKKLSEEHKRKLSIRHKGKHHTEETRRRMSEAQKGDKSYLWRGGISYNPYSIDWTYTLKKSIRERDKYICQMCGDYGMSVHHIDYDKFNCDPMNLICLCGKCHYKTTAGDRIYYEKELKKLMELRTIPHSLL